MATLVTETTHASSIGMWRKILQIAGLATGFALGQGLTFLTQTYLLSQGHTALIGQLAVGMGIVTLTQWFADMGGLNLMSGRHADHQFVWSAIFARLAVALCIVAAVPFCTSWITDPFPQGIVNTGRFVAIIWAVNLTGLLDGARRSGKAGLISFGPWLGCNIATLCVAPTMTYSSGQIIGLSFVCGAIATVAMQYLIARDIIQFTRPTVASVISYLKHGLTCALTHATSLTYNRVLLFLVYAKCDSIATGNFAFVRSLISSIQQALSFVRRVEYPDLVTLNVEGIAKTLKLQFASISVSVAVAVAAILIYPLSAAIASEQFQNVLWLAIVFLATMPFWCFASALGQQFLAKHKTRVNLVITIFATVLSLSLNYVLLNSYGIVVIAFAELIMFLCMFTAYTLAFRRAFA